MYGNSKLLSINSLFGVIMLRILVGIFNFTFSGIRIHHSLFTSYSLKTCVFIVDKD